MTSEDILNKYQPVRSDSNLYHYGNILEAMDEFARYKCIEQKEMCTEDLPQENIDLIKKCILSTTLPKGL